MKGLFFWSKVAGKGNMGETIRVGIGSDWCNVKIAEKCLGKFNIPYKCWILGDQVRICEECVKDLHKEDFPEDFVWEVRESVHEGLCYKETVIFRREEVSFCPKCVREVLLKLERSCTCSCHESGQCDGHLFCTRCRAVTHIDVIYMTRDQTERHS